MKKSVPIALAVLLLISLTACTSKAPASSTQPTVPTVQTASPTAPADTSHQSAFREGYYYSSSESDDKVSYFYEFSQGQLCIETYDANGLADASPEGSYKLENNNLIVVGSDGKSYTYEILQDGALKGESDLLLEFRGSEEPKHMGTGQPSSSEGTSSEDTSPEDTSSPLVFEGKYTGGNMGFENENYVMSFQDSKGNSIGIISEKNPEIAFFVIGGSGLPVENKELIGSSFKIYYTEKNTIDPNTEQPVTVRTLVSAEVSD